MTFPTKQYGVIYADPAWLFETHSDKGLEKSPQAQYDCMTDQEISDLPVLFCAAPDSVCFMWATWPKLPSALKVMQDWGFEYKTGAAWHKRSKTWEKGCENPKTAFGTGYIFRSASELLLVGTHGNPKLKRRDVRNVIEERIREHSRKPDMMYELIESMYDGPYLELFARQTVDGWSSWGNQSNKFKKDE